MRRVLASCTSCSGVLTSAEAVHKLLLHRLHNLAGGVVLGALGGVGEHLVGLLDEAEALGVAALVGVLLGGQGAEGATDLRIGCSPGMSFGEGGSPPTPPPPTPAPRA